MAEREDGREARGQGFRGRFMGGDGWSSPSLVQNDEVWITANFKETQLDVMKPGQKVSISIDAYDGHTFQGKVDSIAAATGARFSLLPA